jgi:hypothetical protein
LDGNTLYVSGINGASGPAVVPLDTSSNSQGEAISLPGTGAIAIAG